MTLTGMTHQMDQEEYAALIPALRQMRMDAQRLNSSLVERLRPFQKSDGSFKTLPDSRTKPHRPGKLDISVASTCTVLMAAVGARKHNLLFENRDVRDVFRQAATRANWGSS